MRWFAGDLVGRCTRGAALPAAVLVAAAMLAVAAVPAGATITPVTHDTQGSLQAWLTQDRCDGTLTTVKRGIVSVRDFKRRRTVSVKAGHSYLARAASKARGAR